MERNAFLFDDVCIPPERQIGMHSHSRWELSYVSCGAGVRTIGDRMEPFRQGEIILIPPDTPHVWQFDPAVTDADGNIANISVFFEPSLISEMREVFHEISEPLERIETLDHSVAYRGEQYRNILSLLQCMRGKTPISRFPMMMELLIAVSDTSDSICTGRNRYLTGTERRLESVRVYCACNYGRPVTLDEMSRHVGMNKSAFCTFMRHNTGMTFSEYLNNMRLERAREKLRHTDYGIAEIAIACGFRNVTYFNRLFRRRYGRTPKETRTN